jgi:hypothetical protein
MIDITKICIQQQILVTVSHIKFNQAQLQSSELKYITQGQNTMNCSPSYTME